MTNIKEKIEKLLALSRNNSSIHEAVLAAKMAQEIAQRYNLEIEVATIEDEEAYGPRNSYKYEDEIINFTSEYGGSTFWKYCPAAWEKLLLRAVAENNGCRATIMNGGNYCNIIGRRKDITQVSTLLKYIHPAIQSCLSNALPPKSRTPEHIKYKWTEGFLFGAVERIRQQLALANSDAEIGIHREEKAGPNVEAAIVRLNRRLTAVDKYMTSLNVSAGDKVETSEAEAWTEGFIAAGAIEINSEKKLEG